MRARLFQRVEREVERFDRRLDQRRRLGRAALEPADGRGERRHSRVGAGERVVRLAQVLGDLLRLHHGGAPLGEHGLLARLRAELVQFGDGVAQPVGLAAGTLDLGRVSLGRLEGLAPRAP